MSLVHQDATYLLLSNGADNLLPGQVPYSDLGTFSIMMCLAVVASKYERPVHVHCAINNDFVALRLKCCKRFIMFADIEEVYNIVVVANSNSVPGHAHFETKEQELVDTHSYIYEVNMRISLEKCTT